MIYKVKKSSRYFMYHKDDEFEHLSDRGKYAIFINKKNKKKLLIPITSMEIVNVNEILSERTVCNIFKEQEEFCDT